MAKRGALGSAGASNWMPAAGDGRKGTVVQLGRDPGTQTLSEARHPGRGRRDRHTVPTSGSDRSCH